MLSATESGSRIGLLTDDRDTSPQVPEAEAANVHVVDPDGSRPDVEGTRHEGDQGRLAPAGGADHRDYFARRDFEVHVLEYRPPRDVAERDVVEGDPCPATDRRGIDRIAGLGHLVVVSDESEDSQRTGSGCGPMHRRDRQGLRRTRTATPHRRERTSSVPERRGAVEDEEATDDR